MKLSTSLPAITRNCRPNFALYINISIRAPSPAQPAFAHLAFNNFTEPAKAKMKDSFILISDLCSIFPYS
jgi:hypothetical protein